MEINIKIHPYVHAHTLYWVIQPDHKFYEKILGKNKEKKKLNYKVSVDGNWKASIKWMKLFFEDNEKRKLD